MAGAWLGGLGTPWNTMQLGWSLRLSSPGLSVECGPGPLAARGPRRRGAEDAASRLATLETLGSYRLRDGGGANGKAGPAQLDL